MLSFFSSFFNTKYPPETNPLNRVVFIQRLLFFVPHNDLARLVELAATCSSFQDTVANYGEAIFYHWRETDRHAFNENFWRVCTRRIFAQSKLELNLVQQFIAVGAPVNLRGRERRGAWARGFVYHGGSRWRRHTRSGARQSLIVAVVENGDFDTLETLLNAGATLGEHVGEELPGVMQSAHEYDCIELLLEHVVAAGEDIDAANDDGDTALSVAVAWREMECVKLLLSHGADANSWRQRKSRQTLLIREASLLGELRPNDDASFVLELAEELINGGADVNITARRGVTALMVALDGVCPVDQQEPWAQVALVKMLIKAGADVSAVDSMGRSVLIQAVEWDCVECAKLLITAGADVNATCVFHDEYGARDDYLYTALSVAARNGNVPLVRAFLDAGASVELGNPSPLRAAVGRSRKNPHCATCVELLLAVNASVDPGIMTLAARSGSGDCIKALLAHPGVNVDVGGRLDFREPRPPLFDAVSSGGLDCVNTLLAAGSRAHLSSRASANMIVEMADQKCGRCLESDVLDCICALLAAGTTLSERDFADALCSAASRGHLACVEALLRQKHANVDCRVYGYTPLMKVVMAVFASRSGAARDDERLRCVTALLDAGADINARVASWLGGDCYPSRERCDRGFTALMLCVQKGEYSSNANIAGVRALLDAGADTTIVGECRRVTALQLVKPPPARDMDFNPPRQSEECRKLLADAGKKQARRRERTN